MGARRSNEVLLAAVFGLALAACPNSSGTTRASPPVTRQSVRHRGAGVDAIERALDLLLATHSLVDLRARPVADLAKEIYHVLYNRTPPTRVVHITQADYAARLHRADRTRDFDPWHLRYGTNGTADLARDGRRFYFDVHPDGGLSLADAIVRGLDATGVRNYSFKIPLELTVFAETWAVLYVEGVDFVAASRIAVDYARQHPDALGERGPWFARELVPGLWSADEPGNGPSPAFDPHPSFGQFCSDIIAEAILAAPPDAERALVVTRVRERFAHYGIDPDRTWLRAGHVSEDVVDPMAVAPVPPSH